MEFEQVRQDGLWYYYEAVVDGQKIESCIFPVNNRIMDGFGAAIGRTVDGEWETEETILEFGPFEGALSRLNSYLYGLENRDVEPDYQVLPSTQRKPWWRLW